MIVSLALVAGCADTPFAVKTASVPVQDADDAPQRPETRPDDTQAGVTELTDAPVPTQTARTVEQFDTTSQADRTEAAAASASSGETRLGETVASLGDVSKPGFWLETALVKTAGRGRVEFAGTGKSAQVELMPIDGPETTGSRISLPAMRLIGASLTDLPTLVVYKSK